MLGVTSLAEASWKRTFPPGPGMHVLAAGGDEQAAPGAIDDVDSEHRTGRIEYQQRLGGRLLERADLREEPAPGADREVIVPRREDDLRGYIHRPHLRAVGT